MGLVFLGPPGAGKGTQAKLLAEERGWPHISTGDILRQAVADQSELGVQAKEFMDSGALVPDHLMCEMVADRLRQPDCSGGWILDGFPRTRVQADSLDETLRQIGRPLERCCYFFIDSEVLVERLTGRLTCGSCGAIFHRKFNPPRESGRCDLCEGELHTRSDDREEAVRRRLEVYVASTAELVAFYEGQSKLARVDADGTVDDVRRRLEERLGDS